MSQELILLLKRLNIIHQQPVNLKHAGTSDFYLDIKKAYGYPSVLDLIAKKMWENIDKNVTCIAAGGYGGLPLASVISSQNNLHLTLIRDRLKSHGKSSCIEGYVPTGHDRIVIVDDVFTTGGSLRKIIKILEPTGAEVTGCCVAVKRGEGKLPVPLVYLLTKNDLL